MTACTSNKLPVAVEEALEEGDRIEILKHEELEGIKGIFYVTNIDGRKEIIYVAEGDGFKGKISLLVFIDVPQKAIKKVEVLEHHETKEYGGYVKEEWFLNRFQQKEATQLLRITKFPPKNEIEIPIITGATVTSEAVVEAVNYCLEHFKNQEEGSGLDGFKN